VQQFSRFHGAQNIASPGPDLNPGSEFFNPRIARINAGQNSQK
jgi:hypothetical protein